MLFPDCMWRVCRKLFILIVLYWFGGKLIKKKTRKSPGGNTEAKLQELVCFVRAAYCMWMHGIILSDNIFKMEFNTAFAINIFVHNLLAQNRNRLKFWIYAPYVNINSLTPQKDAYGAWIWEYPFEYHIIII